MFRKFFAFPLILLTGILASSCFEFAPKDNSSPRTITGRLFEDCKDSTPVANIELTLKYREFLSRQTQITTTDEDGNFTFQFRAEDWHEGGIYGPYYGQLSSNDFFIIEGIKPEHTDLGDLFKYDEEKLVQVYYTVDLSTLLTGDSLYINGERNTSAFFLPKNGTESDTLLTELRGTDNLSPTLFDYTTWLQWRVYSSDTLRLWGNHKAKLENQCQEYVETELVIK